jgi:hypothetical protein
LISTNLCLISQFWHLVLLMFNAHSFLVSKSFNSLLEMWGSKPKLIPCKDSEMLGPRLKFSPYKDISL